MEDRGRRDPGSVHARAIGAAKIGGNQLVVLDRQAKVAARYLAVLELKALYLAACVERRGDDDPTRVASRFTDLDDMLGHCSPPSCRDSGGDATAKRPRPEPSFLALLTVLPKGQRLNHSLV